MGSAERASFFQCLGGENEGKRSKYGQGNIQSPTIPYEKLVLIGPSDQFILSTNQSHPACNAA